MEKNDYRYAFNNVSADQAVIDSLIERGYHAKRRSRLGRRGWAMAAAVALLVVFSATAVAAKVATGSFIGFFVDISGNENLIKTAVIDIGTTQVSGNVALTLDSVVADDYKIYSLFTVETLDGSPLYPEGAGIPSGQVRLGTSWDFGLNFDNNPVSYSFGGNFERIDDGSDPSKAQVIVALQFGSVRVTEGTGRATVYIDEIYGVVTIPEGGTEAYQAPGESASSTTSVSISNGTAAFVTLATGDWRFEFDLNDALSGVEYTLERSGRAYEVGVTPLTLSIRGDNSNEFVSGSFYGQNGLYARVVVETAGGEMIEAAVSMMNENGGIGDVMILCNFERLIVPEEAVAVHIGGESYALKKG